MNIFTQFSTGLVAFTLSAVLFFAGCENPASNDDDHDEEHHRPYGVEFVSNGETIVTHFDDSTEGHFDVEEGGETSLITAKFLDEKGHEIHAEDLDDYQLAWEIGDTEVAEINQDESDRWAFRIKGKTVDETEVLFKLVHGDHPAFETSNAIPIVVQESGQ